MTARIRRNLIWVLACLLAMLAVLAPVGALPLAGAPVLLSLLGIGVPRWLGIRLDVRDVRVWAFALTGGLALAPLLVFTAAPLVPYGPLAAALLVAAGASMLHLSAPAPVDAAAAHIAISRRSVLLIVAMLVVVVVALAPVRSAVRASILPLSGAYHAVDWVKHYGIAWQITVSGLPPSNLLNVDDPPRVHSYYLFYHLTVAMLDQMTGGLLGIDAWLVAVAVAVVAGGLLCTYALAAHLWRSERAAFISLLGITFLGGLDVLPSFEGYLRGEAGTSPWFQPDAWDVGWAEVSTFLTAFTNVPQHMQALAILLLAWLIACALKPSWRAGLLLGLLLVSAAGHSVYVTGAVLPGVALAVMLLAARALRQSGWAVFWRAARPWLAGLPAALIGWPLLTYLLRSGAVGGGGLPIALWVRTAGVGLHRLSTGTPIEALFPGGGGLAQLMDLPAYMLVELGAAGALAVIALLVWRGTLWRGAWLLGGTAAVTSLLVGLFVQSTLGWNDLGIRGILPFQLVAVLWAGGGWLALAGESPGAHGLARSRPSWRWVALAAFVSAGALLAGYQQPWIYLPDVLGGGAARLSVTGFYPVEGTGSDAFRWSGPAFTFPVDGLASNQSYNLSISASAGDRAPAAPTADAQVFVGGAQIGRFTAGPARQLFEFTVPPSTIMARNELSVTVQVASWRPSDFGGSDRRELGLLVDGLRMEPASAALPVLPPPDLVLAALLAGAFAAALGRPRLSSIVFGAALLFGALLFRPWLAILLPYAAFGLGALTFVRLALPPLANWVARGEHARFLRVAVIVLAVAGFATSVWQVTAFDIAKFLPPWDAAASQVDAQSLAFDDALRFIRTQTPRTALLQVDPALQGDGMNWSVTAERRSRLFLDEVFLFQQTPAERTRRRNLVEAAFKAPESAVICGRMRALGLDLILVAKSTGHPWFDDRDTSDGCMRTLYENSLVAVLALER